MACVLLAFVAAVSLQLELTGTAACSLFHSQRLTYGLTVKLCVPSKRIVLLESVPSAREGHASLLSSAYIIVYAFGN
jgi:hypothetical protein